MYSPLSAATFLFALVAPAGAAAAADDAAIGWNKPDLPNLDWMMSIMADLTEKTEAEGVASIVVKEFDAIEEPECNGPAGYVDCANSTDCANDCKTACKDHEDCSCCDDGEEGNACSGFTGKVCTDHSCSGGTDACSIANIKYVVRGCQGKQACFGAGFNGGLIGSVVDSCNAPFYNFNSTLGFGVCQQAAAAGPSTAAGGGYIKSITRSCNDPAPAGCLRAAANGGNITSIVDACQGFAACASAAIQGGNIESITRSCTGYQACFVTANRGGVIKSIEDACQGQNACNDAASEKGFIRKIVDACQGELACAEAATKGGFIGRIVDACIAPPLRASPFPPTREDSGYGGVCQNAASRNETDCACEGATSGNLTASNSTSGFIGTITRSCTEPGACFNTAYEGGFIGSIEDACQGESACTEAGNDKGSIGRIVDACTAVESCMEAAVGTNIEAIDECCKTEAACKGLETFEELNCNTYSPTLLPSISSAPSITPSISVKPTAAKFTKAAKHAKSAKAKWSGLSGAETDYIEHISMSMSMRTQ